ncbi:N-acetylmuramoyl-L-alanine amidase [Pseudoxanthomonas sp. Root630]|uniref:N-acetylmuramoyl-L-alanine amidase n=1 Tax=Pseudoxanthomonas sp. Root630 TaxID=1736574 RepID=UPI000703A419|nr:N-acetylmuramoyl-L-alanine amidase [Pseudoxanthomonas sp. Root630]KRA41903.1 N-acetylmuramoyl-L-alanine amidase [Pseudoxanthomonas sp. Root630]
MRTDLPFTPVIDLLPYEAKLEARPLEQIDLVVIHCTELPDMALAREYGERILHASGTGNSGHYYIDRDGTVYLYVRPPRVAHHVRGYNPRSVGIELVNTGRYPDWLAVGSQSMDEPYTDAQIEALSALLAHLRHELPALRYIAGHEDLDTTREPASDDPSVLVPRKMDPGPLFPWDAVLRTTPLERLVP